MQIVKFQTSYAEPYPLQVVGEASYRDEIEEVTGYTGEDEGVDADDFIAHLILDDNNAYNRGNAVAVEIDGKTVGYLSKPNAKAYRKKLLELGLSDVVGECYASVKGGFIKRDGEQADFGVRLDLDLDDFKPLPPPSISTPEKPATLPTEHIQTPTVASTQTVKPVQSSIKSQLKNILGYFVDPSKDLGTRIILFFLLVSILLGIFLGILQGILQIFGIHI